MQFLIFFCYELIVCPLIFKSDKVYFASSLIAKPNMQPDKFCWFLSEETYKSRQALKKGTKVHSF